MTILTNTEVEKFQHMIWRFYEAHGRLFAWRNNDSPYCVMVSEIMLQQTQTDRVINKFEQFIAAFPTIQDLADADLRDVLMIWQGLGYNRRGKALWQNAKRLMNEFDGIVPNDPMILETFAHIGPNTAGSIVAFAFNKPVVFIETNIRTVYLHTFFKHEQNVHDKQLLPLIAQTVDKARSREWYYALMDYGVYLKKTVLNPSRASVHHAVQTKFEGSDRQIRGRIIKQLTRVGRIEKEALFACLGSEYERYEKIVNGLLRDDMIKQNGTTIFL